MTETDGAAEDFDVDIEHFWDDAQIKTHISDLTSYLGPNSRGVLRPPAWALGNTPEQSEALLALVLSGEKTAIAGRVSDFESEGEEVPEAPYLSILLDGQGHPRALIETTAVRLCTFAELDPDHDGPLDALDPSTPMVEETFRLLYVGPHG